MSKFLNTATVSDQARNLIKSNELVKSDTSRSFGSNLKVWQLALLIGVPTGVLAYLLYRYSLSKTTSKQLTVDKKGEENANKTSKTNNVSNAKVTATESSSSSSTAQSKTPFDKAVEIKNQGNKFFQQGKFEEAAKCYSEAIDLCPASDKQELPKFYQNRAAAYENLKQYEKVIDDCTAALKVDPTYTKALMRRAKAYENIDKLLESFEDLTNLCILDKFSTQAMTMADKMVKKIGEKMAAEKFKTRNGLPISQHFVSNFYIGLNNDIIFNNKKFADEVKSRNALDMLNALNDFESGNYVSCIENCTKEINESGEFAKQARNLRGSLYMLKCQYKEARNDFDAVLNDPAADNRLKSNTLIKLTALNLQNGQETEAFNNYDKAVELDPLNEDIYCNRAQVYAMKGRFEECFNDFNRCLDLNSNHKIARLQKAFFEFRQFYAQLSMYKQATEPENSQAAILNSRELKEETTKLEKLLMEYSDVPEAYNLYAQILSEQENFEKAESYYKMALEKDPKNAALIVQRALNSKEDFHYFINIIYLFLLL